MLTLESPFVAALNHLLEAEPWARERLAPHAGANLELRAPPLPALRFAIDAEGRLAPSAAGAAPSLVVTLKPEAFAELLGRGRVGEEEYLMRAVAVDGDTALAAEVMKLMRHLRWDAEEDLSQLLGDAAAHRMAGAAREFFAWQRDAARRVLEGVMEHAIEERRLVVPRAELAELAAANARLRDGIERLEKRLERLAAAPHG